MATLALSPTPTVGWARQPECWKPTPESQGPEGRRVHDAIDAVLRHRSERSEFRIAQQTLTEEYSYEPVPLEPAFFVRVAYKYIGELRPLPYSLDE